MDTTQGFGVTLSMASSSTATVNCATQDGTAKAGHDYGATSGTAVFSPGTTEVVLVVAIQCHRDPTGTSLTFYMTLSQPVNATIAVGQGSMTIFYDNV
jgi:endoglucanase